MARKFGQRDTPRRRRRGFTLVELMMVFMVISLLLIILMPTINSLIGSIACARARSLVVALSDGALLYWNEHHYYPGQQYTNLLPGGSDDLYTGSQMFGAAMYGYAFDEITGAPSPVNAFADYEPRHLFTWNPGASERRNTVSDTFADPMPMCYYPSRMGPIGRNQFKETDNDVYTTGKIGSGVRDTFLDRIAKPFLGGAAMDGQFLLISPGRDRRYYTQDDICNFRYHKFGNE